MHSTLQERADPAQPLGEAGVHPVARDLDERAREPGQQFLEAEPFRQRRSASAAVPARALRAQRTVAATRMSESVSAGTVVVGDMLANGPCPWTADQTARIEAANSVTPAPAVPNLTAAQRRNGSCSARGACVDTARSGGSSMSAPPKSEDPITMSPTPTAMRLADARP